MRIQKHKISAVLAITAIVLALLVSPALAEKPIEWKCQVFWGAAELTYKTFVDFTERVKEMTNGRLVITPYPAGALVPTFEALDALQDDVIQSMHMWPGYFSGKEPALAAISDMVAAYSAPWQKDAWMHYKGGLDMLREMYKPYNASR